MNKLIWLLIIFSLGYTYRVAPESATPKMLQKIEVVPFNNKKEADRYASNYGCEVYKEMNQNVYNVICGIKFNDVKVVSSIGEE